MRVYLVSRSSRSTLWRNEFGYVDELRISNRHGRIEELVSRDDVAGRAALLEDTDCGLGDHVVRDNVIVAEMPDSAPLRTDGEVTLCEPRTRMLREDVFLRWWRWLTTRSSRVRCLDINWTTQGKWLKSETPWLTARPGRSVWNAVNWTAVFGYRGDHAHGTRGEDFTQVALLETRLLHLGAYCRPMRSISFLMASVSRLDRGKHSNRLILRSRIINASRKAFSICSGAPATAAGSGTPQWAVIG
jgi:hypothetical protein